MRTVLWRCLIVVGTVVAWVVAVRRNRRWKAEAALWESERDVWLAGAPS